jgi:hypothetical protein
MSSPNSLSYDRDLVLDAYLPGWNALRTFFPSHVLRDRALRAYTKQVVACYAEPYWAQDPPTSSAEWKHDHLRFYRVCVYFKLFVPCWIVTNTQQYIRRYFERFQSV